MTAVTSSRHGDNDDGYDAQQQWVDGLVDATAQVLVEYSEGLPTGGNTLEQTDEV
jgi:hypothetical protein